MRSVNRAVVICTIDAMYIASLMSDVYGLIVGEVESNVRVRVCLRSSRLGSSASFCIASAVMFLLEHHVMRYCTLIVPGSDMS